MDKSFFSGNRERLLEQICDNSIVFITSGKAPARTGDQNYIFDVDKNFFYLTGIDKEDFALIISKTSAGIKEKLYMPELDFRMLKWIGGGITPEKATELSGIEVTGDIRSFEKELYAQALNAENIYASIGRTAPGAVITGDAAIANGLRAAFPHINICNLAPIVHDMRYVKQPCEIEEIKAAIAHTAAGLTEMLAGLKPGEPEYMSKARFEYGMMLRGSDTSFTTIAATGKNATCLHYSESKSTTAEGDLMLFDLGGRNNYYCADISRTYPVSGRFNARQRLIYEIVLGCQKECIEKVRPGMTGKEYNDICVKYFEKELMEHGIITDPADVKKYYYHGIGHSLGLDVHDVRGTFETIQEGCVYTVEPGLYIEEWDIGIRIEDDILVTNEGNIVLSADIPKEVDEIEALLRRE